MTRPILHTFAISHFSEKARWGLDWAGVDYELRPSIPLLHIRNARRLRVPASSVPILELNDQAIQGSASILDWASANGDLPNGAEEVEARVDGDLGRSIIPYFYGEAAVEQPAIIPPLFHPGLTPFRRTLFNQSWPFVRRLMIAGMRLGPERRERARARIEGELDWLDTNLADGRPFYAGDKPGRGDIAAAALLAPLLCPPEHPTYADLKLPPKMASECTAWAERPSFAHVKRMYANYRLKP
ncbi:MAG: glutathione S-transferase N-terminal domain-containing protein [Pseudomonadota bacterium]